MAITINDFGANTTLDGTTTPETPQGIPQVDAPIPNKLVDAIKPEEDVLVVEEKDKREAESESHYKREKKTYQFLLDQTALKGESDEVKKLVRNSTFLQYALGKGAEVPGTGDELARAAARTSVSNLLFEGRGAESEDAFNVEVMQAATKWDGGRKIQKQLNEYASISSLSKVAGDKKGSSVYGFTSFMEEAKKSPGYDPKDDFRYYMQFKQQESRTREIYREFPQLESVWGEMNKKEEVDARQQLVNPINLFSGKSNDTKKEKRYTGDVVESSYKAWNEIREASDGESNEEIEAKQDRFLEGLQILARNLPSDEQAAFWSNFQKQSKRDLTSTGRTVKDRAIQIGVDTLTKRMEGSFTYGNDKLKTVQQAPRIIGDQIRDKVNFANDVLKVRDRDFNPMKYLSEEGSWGRTFERGVYGSPGAISSTLMAAVPLVGQVSFFTMAKEGAYQTYRERFEEQGLSKEDSHLYAEGLSTPGAFLELLAERFQTRAIAGKSAFLEDLIQQATKRMNNVFVRGVVRGVVNAGEQGVTETLQGYIYPTLENIASGLGAPLEGQVIRNGKDGILDGFWTETVEMSVSMSPLAFFGGFKGAIKDSERVRTFRAASDTQITAFGGRSADLEAFRNAKTEGEEIVALDNLVKNLAPQSDEAKAAHDELQAQLNAEQQLENTRLSQAPRIVKSPEGYSLYDRETGEKLVTVKSQDEVIEAVQGHMAEVNSLEEEEMMRLRSALELTDIATQDVLGLDQSGSNADGTQQAETEIDISTVFGEARIEAAMDPADIDRFREEMEIQRKALGLPEGTEFIAVGDSKTEFRGTMRYYTQKIYQGSNPLTVFHEMWHNVIKRSVSSGRLNREKQIRIIRMADNAIGETRVRGVSGKKSDTVRRAAFLPEGITDDLITDTMIDEAMAEIGEIYSYMNRKKGVNSQKFVSSFTNALLSGNAFRTGKRMVDRSTEEAKEKNAGKIFLSLLKAARGMIGLQMTRAAALRKAAREGNLDVGAIEKLLSDMTGTSTQEAHDAAVENEAKAYSLQPSEAGSNVAATIAAEMYDNPSPEALEGLPSVVRVNGNKVKFGPFETARKIAAEYVASTGREFNPPKKYAKVDTSRANRIADEFDKMPHTPNDPEVKAAYKAMINETLAQYEFIKKTGLEIEPVPEGQADPYGNPRNAILDVINNNHLWFFPTTEGFGGSASSDIDVSGNPLLEKTGEVINGHEMLANDVFRVVHDYFGHIKEGVGFRADGEENAWRSHSSMYSPLAMRAMTTETRGQNSWVNFGPYAAMNATANGVETQYAPQKIGLLPEWVSTEGASDSGISFQVVAKLESSSEVKEYLDNKYEPIFEKLGIPVLLRNFGYDAYLSVDAQGAQVFLNAQSFVGMTNRQVDAIAREELIHAASYVVLKNKGIDYFKYHSDLYNLISEEGLEKIFGEEVYRSADGPIEFAAEFKRVAIQKMLYGKATEEEMSTKTFKKIGQLLKDVVSFFTKRLAKVKADPIQGEVFNATIELLKDIDPKGTSGKAFSLGIAPSNLSIKTPKGVKAIRTDSLPIWKIEKYAGQLPKVLKTPAAREKFYARLDEALDYLREDPSRIISATGWVKFLRMAGIYGEVPMPPSGLADIILNPSAYVEKLTGGYHGERTLLGTQESAKQGLDGTMEMREIIGIGKAPAPWNVALHHLWGILSRMLPPLQQEGMWLRLISHRPVLDAIQTSIDGEFSLTLEQWEQLVKGARENTADGAGSIGNSATANANAFYLMLRNLNGRWQDLADVYAEPNSKDMGRKFWSLDAGSLGVKNKVQRFIGLTFGVPGVIMDRWKFVEFWLPTGMEGKKASTPSDYFSYGQNTPSDPFGIYGTYGDLDSKNPALSLAMYEAFETVLQEAINKSPELKAHLGDHANPGGMHWHGWNAIKNEAVGHSSLDLTKDLQRTYGVDITAQNVHDSLLNGTYYTEGAETQTSNLKFILERGKIRTERVGISGGLQSGHTGILGRGTREGTSESELSEDSVSAYSLQPVANKVEAERLFADGKSMFAIHEMDDEVAQIDSLEMLRSYSTDMIYWQEPQDDSSAFSVSPQIDAEYMAAAKAGNTSKLQKMVDAAAKASGYLIGKVFHGTKQTIDVFEHTRDFSKLFYFSEDRKMAETYPIGTGGHRDATPSVRARIDKVREESKEWLDKEFYKLEAKYGDFDSIPVEESAKVFDNKNKREEKQLDGMTVSRAEMAMGINVYETYLKVDNLFEPSEHWKEWLPRMKELLNLGNESEWSSATRESIENGGYIFWEHPTLIDEILASGYDGIRIQESQGKPATTIAVRNSEQIKSADPITRDKDGNIIPLSQRFDSTNPSISYSVAPSDIVDKLSSTATKRIKDPLARMKIYEKMLGKLNKIRDLIDSRGVAFNFDSFGQPYGKPITNEQEGVLNALAILDGIISSLPIEIRGKVGGYTQLAKLTTYEQRFDYLKRKMGTVDKVINKWMQEEFTRELEKLLKQSRAKRAGGDKAKGKIGAKAHRYFEQVEEIWEMTEEQVELEMAKLDKEIEEKGDEADLVGIAERYQLLLTVGDFKNKAPEEIATALKNLSAVYVTGRNIWRMKEEARIGEMRRLVVVLLKDLGNLKTSDVQKTKAASEKLFKSMAEGTWSIISFHETLEEAFGADSEITQRWARAVRNGMRKRTTAIIEANKRWSDAVEKATGQKGIKGRRIVWEMSNKQTVNAILRPVTFSTIKVPIDTFFDAKKQKELGLSAKEIKQLKNQFDALPANSKKGNLTLEREIVGETDPITYTEAEALSLTMAWGQDMYKKAMTKHGMGEEFQRELEYGLSDAAKSLRTFLLKEYENNYEPLRRMFENMFGANLRQTKNYAPGKHYSTGAEKTMDVSGSGFVEGGFQKGFLADRKKHMAETKAENAFQVYFSHLNQTEHWKAMAEVSREMHSVLGRPEVKKALAAKDINLAAALNEWMNAIDGNGLNIPKSSKALQKIIESQAYIALAYKMTTMLKNFFGASVNATYKMPLRLYLKGAAKVMAGKVDFAPVWNSDVIQNRLKGGFAPEVRAAISNALGAKPRLRADLLLKGMEFIGTADAYGTAFGAAIFYDHQYTTAFNATGSKEIAHSIAMDQVAELVSRTSQPVEVTDKSLMELRLGGPGKFMFVFASEARQKSAMWTLAWAHTLTGKATKKDVRVLVAAHLIAAPLMHIISSAIRDARDPEDDEWIIGDDEHWNPIDLLISMATGPVSGIPLIRDIFDGYNGESGPLKRFYDAGGASMKLLDAIFDEEPDHADADWYERQITKLLQGLGPTPGVGASVFDQAWDLWRNFTGK